MYNFRNTLVMGTIFFCNISSHCSAETRWHAECKKDGIDDKVQCQLTDAGSNLLFFSEDSDTLQSVCVFTNDFPGRSAAIRVDKNRAIITGDDGCTSAKALLSQLKKGKKILTQSYQWPDDFPQEATGETLGFMEEFQKIPSLRKNAK